jgi:hypothetical protein
MTSTGINEATNNGVVNEIITIIAIKLKKQYDKSFKFCGIEFSLASISLLNLLIMRPLGVDSKKRILLRKIENNNELCKYLTALINIIVCTVSPKRDIVH